MLKNMQLRLRIKNTYIVSTSGQMVVDDFKQ